MVPTGREAALSARAFLPLISGLRALGHDPSPLLSAVGVDPLALRDPDARIPMSAGSGLLARAAAASGDDVIGLHLAESADLRTVDVHFYAMAASATLREAYERLSRYQRLIHETTRIDLTDDEAGLTLRHVLPGGLTAPRQTAEFLLAAWIRTGRLVTAHDWNPVEVRFAHTRPSQTDAHERFFRAPVRFSAGEHAVVIAPSTLSLRCVGADPALASLLDRHAREHMGTTSGAARTFPDRVRDVLVQQLQAGEPRVTATARRLKMSSRTLHRTLAGDGTSYSQLLDQLRHDIARHLLRDSTTSIGDVAFRLGFSELSAFSRAFKRWTGLAPADFRKTSGERSVRPPGSRRTR